jgi:signal transduction histidine kinase
MRASAEMLQRNISPDNDIANEMAGFIASEVDRTNSLITRFLEFARPVHLQVRETDITRVLDAAVAEFERHNPPLPVTVHRNYLPDLPLIRADAELLQRVFYNLILNAAQSSPPGSSVTVKVRPASDFLQIDIIDRGKGIAPKHMEQIFNPFFTTRPDGVGLGLAIVSRIVDEHSGSMRVDSEPGHGTVFHVFLPRDAAQLPPPPATAAGNRN